MESNVLEAVWLNESGQCTMVHLAEVSGLNSAELQSLVDSGVLAPLPAAEDSLAFATSAMLVVRTARRLRDDFELSPVGLALAMQLLERVHTLDRELERVRAGLAGSSQAF